MVGRITPRELQSRLAAGEPLVLVDVREPDEWALCRIEGAVHIPMGEILSRAHELNADVPIVCICHHGVRSARVAGALEQRGFSKVLNLSGGIDRWADEVAPGMTRY